MKVAVIGSGPAGLATAAELAKIGYKVDVFESGEHPGGMMTYCLPSYRLPRKIVEAELDSVKRLGIEIKTNTPIKDKELLTKGYDAIFVGTGTPEPVCMGIPGENMKGVFQGINFLRQISTATRRKKDLPQIAGKQVAVVGGGDVAIDVAISAVQLGAKRTHLLYRRSFEEMPANPSGVSEAKEHGVMFWILTDPKRIIGDAQGRVKAVECIEMKLGKPDKSGRRSPIPIPGTEFKLPVEVVIEACGQKPNDELIKTLELKTASDGTIKVDKNGESSRKGVFAGGDVTNGGATVVQAIAEGVRAAIGIDKSLGKT